MGAGCRVLSTHNDGGSGDGDGFLPLSRVQSKLILGLMVGVGGLCDTCLKINSVLP